jgi:hypothetical protein
VIVIVSPIKQQRGQKVSTLFEQKGTRNALCSVPLQTSQKPIACIAAVVSL